MKAHLKTRPAPTLRAARGLIPFIAPFLLVVASAQDAGNSATNAWVAPPRAARKQNPVPSDTKSLAQGKELFLVGCSPCHGPAGKGDGLAASTLERDGKPIRPGNLSDPKLWQQTDGTIFWKISEGKSPMPSFQETFSEEQRWLIVNYVRTLAPKQETKKQGTNSGGNHEIP